MPAEDADRARRSAAAARSRPLQVAWLAATIALGLLSRRFPLPGVFAEHTGDALYAVATFFAFAAVAPRARGAGLAIAAFAFAAAVEFSQRCEAGWLVALRATRAGALLLGQGFQWADLLAYAIGAAAAWCVDRVVAPRA